MTSLTRPGSVCVPGGSGSPSATRMIFSGRTVMVWPSRSIRLDTPMNPATNGVAGRSYTSTGGPVCSIRPPLSTAMRSLIVSASSWSCVTYTNVMLTWRCTRCSSSCISWRSFRSSAPSGSSSSSTSGSLTMARASATRWRWPPDSWAGLRPPRPGSRTISSAWRRLLPPLRPATLRTRRPYSMFCATVMCGNSA